MAPSPQTAFAVAFSHAAHGLAALPRDADQRAHRSAVGRRLAMQAAARLMLPPAPGASIEVVHDRHGRPCLAGATDIDVSISHSGHGVAGAAARGLRIGIDLEPLDDIPARSWRYFLTDAEARACAPRPRRALWTWTIKEAAYKALASQRPLRFKEMAVHGWDDARGPRLLLADAPAREPRVFLREHRGFALAIVLVQPRAAAPEDAR